MGCMVMGSLIVKYVTCLCGLTISSSVKTYSIQTHLLDQICLGLLPLAATMLFYFLLQKKRWSVARGIVLIFLLGILGGITGILTV